MTLSFLYRAFWRVLQLIRLVARKDTDLATEVVVLRQEVAVRRRQVHRPALEPADRALLAGLARLFTRQRLEHLFVQPATLLRWHRGLVDKRWTYPHGRPGRPGIAKGTTGLILQLAKENPTWGYRRIHGELATMGVTIAASSVWAILKRHGIDPSPRRSGPTWTEFLATQAKGLMACDFFHVDTLLLRRLYVLVFIHHDSRRVRIAGITTNPVSGWVTQQARNISMELADQANAIKFLIRDRDTKFTASFDAIFAADGTRVITTPVRAPRAKPRVERQMPYVRDSMWRGRSWAGVSDMQSGALRWCVEVAGVRSHRSLEGASPLSVFEAVEAPALGGLPAGRFELAAWSSPKVGPDCHVKVGRALYSVPWRHIGARVDARATEKVVEVFVGTVLVKTHPRVERGRQTDWGDYPPEKVAFFMRTPVWCRKKAAELGEHVEAVVCDLLTDGALHHLRAAQGIIGLAERHGTDRLDAACARAIAVGDPTYRTIKGILSAGTETDRGERAASVSSAPAHLHGPVDLFDGLERNEEAAG